MSTETEGACKVEQRTQTLPIPEFVRTYSTLGSTREITLVNVVAFGVRRADGSHYLETGDGMKHIITTINGALVHIAIDTPEWSI